jgi:hypothetical protein
MQWVCGVVRRDDGSIALVLLVGKLPVQIFSPVENKPVVLVRGANSIPSA